MSEYLSREIPNRALAETMLLEALPGQVGRFLDIGCGDGRLLALVGSHHPDAYGVGVDISEPMLRRARTRFADDPQISVYSHDLAAPLREVAGVMAHAPFDAIVSGLAIHHLDDVRKRSLFAEVHALLAPGGVFVNLDLVRSASQAQHERFRQAIGRQQDDPSDQLAPLGTQTAWMADAGFSEADCQFKWLELALFVGRACQ